MFKIITATIICVLCFQTGLYSGTTGKIAGAIKDADSGEPLIGVNVTVEGTSLGAATDVDGTYIILNVPPGLYNIIFNYIGYQSLVVKEVRVNVDFTTRLDQNLTATVLEGEVVEVFGERNPLVRQDLTNTQVAVTSETLMDLPVDQVSQVIALQAGITVDNSGALHIRGGRSGEISYQVNGLSINNPYGNEQGVGVAVNAVQEVSVSTGTFSAEYGNALSGVINFVTKDGGNKFNGSLRAWTGDNLSNNSDVFYNIDDIDPFNNYRAEWTFSGPIPLLGNKLTFFTSGVYQNDKGHLYGIRIYNPEDLMFFDADRIFINPFGLSFTPGPNNTVFANVDPSRAGANGDGANVPMVTRESLNLTGKLTWKPFTEMKISYDIIFDDGNRYNRNAQGINAFRRYRFTPEGRPKTTSRNYSHSIGITHTLSQRTFYTLKLGYNQNNALTSVFEDKFDPGYVPSFDDDIQNHILPQTDYTAGGMDLARTEENSESYLAKFDLVSQLFNTHELKFGGEYIYHFLDFESFTYQTSPRFPNEQLFRFIIPDPEEDSTQINYQSYDHQPVQFSVYVLDKMELAKQFIFNIGLRYEYFHSRALYNPNLAGTVDLGVNRGEFLKYSEPKHNLMPRMSLSFPITSEGIIRFSYGVFYQYPNMRKIYRNPRFVDNAFNPPPNFGFANLEPERSTQYELGLQQQFTRDLKMDLTIFYKDVTNLIEDRRIIAGEVAFSKEFNVYTNISFAKVRGFTASLLKRRSLNGLFSATLDYTFMDGKGAFTDAEALAVNTRTGRSTEQKLVPLDFDRTHVLNGTITIGKTNNWLVSAIANLRSGTPYTPSVPQDISPVSFETNSDRRPFYKNVDLKLEKYFRARAVRYSIFLQVNNVFDTMNNIFVHTNTGRSLTNLESSRSPNRFNNLKDTISESPQDYFPVEFLDNYYQREDWLSDPREMRLGMTFDF
jgi:outer membrane receptor protein involved in Fe transport